ncbi:ATP-binding protein [Thermocoleostomius sinensis]|uniref:histidine kinase n=1 Tax=Thermocoleostomius sinensis A174 TaxID=2016057 RepID=A0A9E8ZFR8_9CYAN|nr:ATP-binding protein [Thermocoleostomius sinensis]WAL62001.1 ATP-binding protein [Thermocoleostomius sinensis A174]
MVAPLLHWLYFPKRSAKTPSQRTTVPLHLVLIVPFVLLSTGAVGIVGYLSWRSGQRAISDVVEQLQAKIGDHIEEKLTVYLETPHLINRINADAVQRGELNVTSRTSERYLWQQIQRFESVSWIYYGSEQEGSFVGITRANPDRSLQIVVNDATTNFEGHYYTVDSQGNRQQRVQVISSIYDARSRPWYQTAVQKRQASWSEIYQTFELPSLIISAALPLYNTSGDVLGVVGADLDLEDISHFLASLEISPSGQAFIVERSGQLVASSASETPYRFNERLRQPQRLLAIESTDRLIQSAARHLNQQFGSLDSILGEQQLDFYLSGQRQFLRVLPFRDRRGIDWLIVVVVPESDFIAQIYAQRRTTIVLCTLALLGTIALGLWMSRWISYPIQQLSQASGLLAQGDWHEPLNEDSPITELQVLTHSFNYTATQLQQSFCRVRTALEESQEKFTDSEARFRHAFHDAPIGMALIGLDDRWLQVNPMLCDMLGYPETELLTMTASTLVHPDDLSKLNHNIQQLSQSDDRNAQVELRYCCQDGRVAWGRLSLSLVRDVEDCPCYYVAQIQDITEQHAIDRMKNEFISIVSHELRTPLTAIRGFLGLLDTGIYDNKPDKAKHMITQALTNSDRLVRLVNDILELERQSSGRVQWVMEVCQAATLINQAIAGMQSIADEALINLVVSSATGSVWAAPDAMIQTLTNLLSNAIKFSPPHSIITLSAQPHLNHVLFQVKDQGRGIPDDKLEMIFERFQQVDVSDARQKGGTGLGLAICQSIIHQHGGKIWVESHIGVGSTFYFTIPSSPSSL